MGIAHRGARRHPRCAAPAADRSVYFLRAVQDDHRESVGPIVVPAGGATPGTIGGVGRLNVARRYVPRSDPRAATTASDDVVIRLSM